MTEFIYPIATVVVDFICVLLCIRFLIVNRRSSWLLGILMSNTLLLGAMVCLLAIASGKVPTSYMALVNYICLYLFIISVIWILCVLGFNAACKTYSQKAKEAKAEAEYLGYLNQTQPKKKDDSVRLAKLKSTKK